MGRNALGGVRYLVVVPLDALGDVRFVDVERDDEVAVGDRLLVDDLNLCVRLAVEVAESGYDGTLICTPDLPDDPTAAAPAAP